MNRGASQQLEKIILNHISWLLAKLEDFVSEQKLMGNLVTGCWSNANDLVFGWVGYAPDDAQRDEVIELTFALSPETDDTKRKFEIDICWSDGAIIQEIAEFDNIILSKAASQIDTIIMRLRDELLLKMKKQIKSSEQKSAPAV